jgi:hypothetical protein
MANVKFLQGNKSNIPSVKAELGAFYLAKDTCELYYGVAEGKAPQKLNESVTYCDSIQDLPKTSLSEEFFGRFFYAANENILCVYGENKEGVPGWIQINPDTNTNTEVTSLEIVESGIEKVDGEDAFKFNVVLTQKDLETASAKEAKVETAFYIKKSMLANVSGTAVATDAEVNVKDQIVTIKATGIGSDISETASTATIKAGDNITFAEGENEDIVISATDTTYELSQEGNKISLVDAANNPFGSVEFKVGDELSISNATGEITYAHEKKGPAGGATVGLAADVEKTSRTFKVPYLKVNEYGHVTEATEHTYTLPDDKDTTYTAQVVCPTEGDIRVDL